MLINQLPSQLILLLKYLRLINLVTNERDIESPTHIKSPNRSRSPAKSSSPDPYSPSQKSISKLPNSLLNKYSK